MAGGLYTDAADAARRAQAGDTGAIDQWKEQHPNTGWFGMGGQSRVGAANRAYGKGGTVEDFGVPGFDKLNAGYIDNAKQRSRLGDAYGARDAYVSDQRDNQVGLGNMLLQEARGKGVGQKLVGMQARDAANRASAQQFAALGGARPGMQAMAARNAMLGSALAQSAVGNQAALGSAQMTLGAQQQYGQHLQGVRGQDESNQFANRQLNDQSQLNAYGQQMGLMEGRRNLAGMGQQGNQAFQQNQTNRWQGILGQPTRGERTLGAVTGLGGAMMNFRSGLSGGMSGMPSMPNSGPVDISQIPQNAGNSTAGYNPYIPQR